MLAMQRDGGQKSTNNDNKKTVRRTPNIAKIRRRLPPILCPDAEDRVQSYNNTNHNILSPLTPLRNMSPHKSRYIEGFKKSSSQTPESTFGFSPLTPSQNVENGMDSMTLNFQRFQFQETQEDQETECDLVEHSLFPMLPIVSPSNLSMLPPSDSVLQTPSLPSPSRSAASQEHRNTLSCNMVISNTEDVESGSDRECKHESEREEDGSSSPILIARSAAPSPLSPDENVSTQTVSLAIPSEIINKKDFPMWPPEFMYAWSVEQMQQNAVHRK